MTFWFRRMDKVASPFGGIQKRPPEGGLESVQNVFYQWRVGFSPPTRLLKSGCRKLELVVVRIAPIVHLNSIPVKDVGSFPESIGC